MFIEIMINMCVCVFVLYGYRNILIMTFLFFACHFFSVLVFGRMSTPIYYLSIRTNDPVCVWALYKYWWIGKHYLF